MKESKMLRDKIQSKEAKIGIVGLGYVGLPLSVTFHQVGFQVLGFDVDGFKVDFINKGGSYIEDVPDSLVKFSATTEMERLGDMDVIIICVPTPLKPNKEPDLSYIESTLRTIRGYLGDEVLVVLESTTYPGTTSEIVRPELEALGRKLYLAHVPERIDPGSKLDVEVPKVIGGIDNESTDLACLLYSSVGKVVPVSSPEVAEMTKMLENTFRNVNIALVNEMVELCRRLGISIWEVIEAAKTKPYGYMPFYPNIGVGGHCTPVDPHFLRSRAQELDLNLRFVETAAAVNNQMPYYVAERIARLLNGLEGKRILILGVTYKKNISDLRESPSIKLAEILRKMGAKVVYNDPCGTTRLIPSLDLEDGLKYADVTVIAVDHDGYDWNDIVSKSKRVFDCKGVTLGIEDLRIERL